MGLRAGAVLGPVIALQAARKHLDARTAHHPRRIGAHRHLIGGGHHRAAWGPVRKWLSDQQVTQSFDGKRRRGGGGGGTIAVSPAQVFDSALAGETTPRVTTLSVNGSTWFATIRSPWINVAPQRGGPRATVRLSLDPQNLTPGLHLRTVTLQEHDRT